MGQTMTAKTLLLAGAMALAALPALARQQSTGTPDAAAGAPDASAPASAAPSGAPAPGSNAPAGTVPGAGVQGGGTGSSGTSQSGSHTGPNTVPPASGGTGSGGRADAGSAGSGTASGTASGNGSGIAPGVTLAAKALDVKPGHYALDPAHGKITWSVNHLGFSTYGGMFGAVSADLTLDPHDIGATALTATIDTADVTTMNAKLDEELKSDAWFDVSVYPQASFKSTKVTVTGPQSARIDGDLTLRGKTAPIVISATFNNAGIDPIDKKYTVGFDGASIIRRSTFGISKYVPFVGDNVTLRLEGEFKLVS